MMKETQVICADIFKSGNKKNRKKEFTRRWGGLANPHEKDKGSTAVS